MAGMQWTIDTMHQYNTRIASMSLGGPGAIEWTSSEEDSVNRQKRDGRAGIALYIAAGNNAVSAQIGTPVPQRMSLLLVHSTRTPQLLYTQAKDRQKKVE